jgi:Leucine-rich repeat (LRR) protein
MNSASSDASANSNLHEENESDGVLKEDEIATGLSKLGRSADGSSQVFLVLSLPGRGLSDISPLSERFVHLQSLELQYNNLSDLSALSGMCHLLYLNVSHNKLTSLLDFKPPLGLREVDASFNKITEIPDLSPHHLLTKLVLSCNSISELTGLTDCHSLQHFAVAHNQIERISELDRLPIKYLDLVS